MQLEARLIISRMFSGTEVPTPFFWFEPNEL